MRKATMMRSAFSVGCSEFAAKVLTAASAWRDWCLAWLRILWAVFMLLAPIGFSEIAIDHAPTLQEQFGNSGAVMVVFSVGFKI
jgi:hypothetical protein